MISLGLSNQNYISNFLKSNLYELTDQNIFTNELEWDLKSQSYEIPKNISHSKIMLSPNMIPTFKFEEENNTLINYSSIENNSLSIYDYDILTNSNFIDIVHKNKLKQFRINIEKDIYELDKLKAINFVKNEETSDFNKFIFDKLFNALNFFNPYDSICYLTEKYFFFKLNIRLTQFISLKVQVRAKRFYTLKIIEKLEKNIDALYHELNQTN